VSTSVCIHEEESAICATLPDTDRIYTRMHVINDIVQHYNNIIIQHLYSAIMSYADTEALVVYSRLHPQIVRLSEHRKSLDKLFDMECAKSLK